MRATATVGVILLTLPMFCSGCGRRPPAHGEEFVVEIHSGQVSGADYQKTVDALRRRLDFIGRSASFFEPTGSNQVRILVAAFSPAEKASARRQITNSAVLEFRLVHPESEELLKRGEVPSDCELLKQPEPMRGRIKMIEAFIVKKEPVGGLTSRFIRKAAVVRDNLGRTEIMFELNPTGTRIFADITRTNVGQRIALVLNGQVITAPRIEVPIEQGSGEIVGEYDTIEAFEIADLLENPLSAPVTILAQRSF